MSDTPNTPLQPFSPENNHFQQIFLSLNNITNVLQDFGSQLQMINQRLVNVETDLSNLNTKFNKLDLRLTNLEEKVIKLEEKVEERLHDTRPMWQEMLQRMTKLESDMDQFRREMRQELREIKIFVHKEQAQMLELDKRIERLEEKIEEAH